MKKLIGSALAFFLCAAAAQADHFPLEPPKGVVEYEGRVAALFSYGEFDPVLELKARLEDEEREFRYRAVTLGSYYRFHRNVKAGAFLRVQQGTRHDDDWINLNSGWTWDGTTDRTEVVAIADITPRFQLGFLPGENWVLAVKGRYELNTDNMQQSVKLRPGLTYFWIVDRNPLLNVSLAYEAYFPLNFGATLEARRDLDFPLYRLTYERWIYLNLLYHLTPTVKLEASLARRSVTWTDSKDFDAEAPTESYQLDYEPWVVGLGVLYMIPF